MEPSIFPNLKRVHARRLRELFRSAGWPYQDVIEIELLAVGLLERVQDATGVDCMRVTDTGIQYLASAAQSNQACLSDHNTLVDVCPGQVFSHMPIGCLIADFCSKALGGKLPSLECSRWLL